MHLLGIVAIIYVLIQWIKEKTEKTVPKGARFDWDAFYKDIENGVPNEVRLKKHRKGLYTTTKPLPDKPSTTPATPSNSSAQPVPEKSAVRSTISLDEIPFDAVIDTKRYEHDVRMFGQSYADRCRRSGEYRHIKKETQHKNVVSR